MKKKILYLLYLLLLVVLLVPTLEEAYQRSRFLAGNDFYQKDSIAGFVHTPDYTNTYEWPEHPLGKITVKTNNLGFKNDSNTTIKKDTNTIRILFTGDSHTDGVVYNNESFAHVLENSLNDSMKAGGKKIECINGGSGYYSFKQYDGFLKKYIPLQPDVFVVVVYTGNDFLETQFYDVNWYNYFQNSRNFLYKVKKKFQLGQSQDYLAQSFAQTLYANMFPSTREKMVETAMHYIDDIRTTCKNQNIQLKFVLLPNLLDYDSSMQQTAMEKMKLSSSQTRVNREITTLLMKKMDEKKIGYLDLLPLFEHTGDNLFWKRDQHLNIEGHKVVASALKQSIERPGAGNPSVNR